MINFSSKAFGQSANLDQIRNGSLGVYPTTPTADWVNGNAGPSNAHFAEGYSIPYRARVSDLVGTSSTVHHLIIEWDTKHSNGHALDYITHYQNLDNPVGSHAATFGHGPEVIDPTLGTSFSGAPTLFQIPTPSSTGSEVAGQPTASFNALPTAAYTNNTNITKMAIWGGTITSLTYVFQDAPDGTTGQTETRLDIAFTANNGTSVLIAWAGHIAAEYDWGAGRGATGVSGSPYHTRVITIDGKPGNQDRSLKATAVIIPPPLCGISPAQFACPETASLTYSATGSSTGSNVSYLWTLTNGSTSAGAKIDGSNTGFSISVVPIGTDFIPGGTFNLSLTVSKTGAESTTCNRSPAGTISPTPTVSAIYNPPTCSSNTFSIDVPNSVSGSSYKVTQGGEVNPTYNQTKAGTGGTLNFTGLAVGGGFLVRVTNSNSCTATTDCASSTNSCSTPANIITQSKVDASQTLSKTEEYDIVLESPTKVKVAPNPYSDRVKFNLVSGVSGIGSLELYNTLGQKVATVYEGYIQAGRAFNKEYTVPVKNRSTLMYVFKVGDQKATGKLVDIQ